jgi:hypothetical protein
MKHFFVVPHFNKYRGVIMSFNKINIFFSILCISSAGFSMGSFEENKNYLCVGNIELSKPVEIKVEFFSEQLKSDKPVTNFAFSVEYNGIIYSKSSGSNSGSISYAMQQGERELFPVDNINLCSDGEKECLRPSYMPTFNISSKGYYMENQDVNFNLSPLHESEVPWDLSPKFEVKFSGSVGYYLRNLVDLKLVCNTVE